jgi:hypothetical protein
MSDYLDRAIERETSTGLAVRPALPSLFEPGPPSAITTPLETESPIEPDPVRNTPDETNRKISPLQERLTEVDVLWTDPAAGAPEQPRQSEETAGKSSAGLADTPISPSTTAAFSTESSPAKPQLSEGAAAPKPAGRLASETPAKPLRAATQEIVRPAGGAPPRLLQTATEEIVRPTGVPQPSPIHPAAAQEVVRPVPPSPSAEVGAVPTIDERAAPSPTAPVSSARGSREPSDKSSVRSARGSSEPEPATPPAPAPLTKVVVPVHTTIPHISPAPSGPDRARSADNNAFSPRSVHITIGRIEVRAVHPPPEPVPRHRPAPAAPRISLEEYLKKRNGDRR